MKTQEPASGRPRTQAVVGRSPVKPTNLAGSAIAGVAILVSSLVGPAPHPDRITAESHVVELVAHPFRQVTHVQIATPTAREITQSLVGAAGGLNANVAAGGLKNVIDSLKGFAAGVLLFVVIPVFVFGVVGPVLAVAETIRGIFGLPKNPTALMSSVAATALRQRPASVASSPDATAHRAPRPSRTRPGPIASASPARTAAQLDGHADRSRGTKPGKPTSRNVGTSGDRTQHAAAGRAHGSR